MLLSFIGEQFTDAEHLLGCCVAIRKAFIRIEFWLGSTDADIVQSFGDQVKQMLELNKNEVLEFRTFREQLGGDSKK